MKLFKTIEEIRRWTEGPRRKGLAIGFVPTMGALHEGHLSLIRRAKDENRLVVASVFVNPLQFGPKEDFSRYPRPIARDKALCARAGVDALFLPSAGEVYPEGFRTHVEVEGFSELLCGQYRPGHFRGVATVVLKLFEIVRPDRAYFGEKDYQQLTLLRRMARDLNLAIEIVGCQTVREADGLAMSSRNAYLSRKDRAAAPRIHRALVAGQDYARLHPKVGAEALLQVVRAGIAAIPGARPDYVSLVDADTLIAAPRVEGELRLLAAVRLGKTRLIDNVPVICEDRRSRG